MDNENTVPIPVRPSNNSKYLERNTEENLNA